MKIPYTYRNKHGIYYFRWIIPNSQSRNRTEIRFSLRTSVASDARIRSYRAWLYAKSLNGPKETVESRDQIRSFAVHHELQDMPSLRKNRYGPELVTLSKFIDNWNETAIQNAVTQIHNDGGRILVPFGGDKKCAHFRTHDPEYEEEPVVPLDLDFVPPQDVVLTKKGVESTQFTKDSSFSVTDFYSFHPSYWNEKDGFFVRFSTTPPFKVKLSELLVTKSSAEQLQIPKVLSSGVISHPTRPCGLISEELARYSERKHSLGRWTDRTKQDNDCVFETFVEIIGDKPVYAIKQDDIEKYVRTLKTLPPNRKKNSIFKNMNAGHAASLNAERGGGAISNSSKNKYIERLSGPFTHFVADEFCTYNFFKNTEGYKVTRADKLAAREPFSDDDLSAMFEGEHSIKLLKSKRYMPSRPWGLLIALYTGARASEIFSLAIEDIKKDGETLYFDIKVYVVKE